MSFLPHERWGVLDTDYRDSLMNVLYKTKREALAMIREVSGQDGNPPCRYSVVKLDSWMSPSPGRKAKKQ